MKYFLALALFASGTALGASTPFFGSWVPCSPGIRGICLDGAWWQRLSASQKPAVTEAMIASYLAGYRLAQFNFYSEWLSVYGTGTPTAMDRAFLKRFRNASADAPEFDRTTSEYVAAIDRFYRIYPRRRTLELGGVLRCLNAHAEFSCDVVGRSDLLPWPTGP